MTSVLNIWWCPCVEFISCVVGRACLLWPLCSLDKTLLAFALLHLLLQGQTCLLLQVSLDLLLLHSNSLWWKGYLLCVCVYVLVLEGLVGLHRTVELQLLWHEWGKTWSWDHELLIGKLRLKLKKVGKTTRTFRYDLNQITYDYTVQVMNQEIRSGRPEYLKNYEWRFIILYKRQWPKPSQRNARRQSGCLKRSYK